MDSTQFEYSHISKYVNLKITDNTVQLPYSYFYNIYFWQAAGTTTYLHK
jgi:hypothetical protein